METDAVEYKYQGPRGACGHCCHSQCHTRLSRAERHGGCHGAAASPFDGQFLRLQADAPPLRNPTRQCPPSPSSLPSPSQPTLGHTAARLPSVWCSRLMSLPCRLHSRFPACRLARRARQKTRPKCPKFRPNYISEPPLYRLHRGNMYCTAHRVNVFRQMRSLPTVVSATSTVSALIISGAFLHTEHPQNAQ